MSKESEALDRIKKFQVCIDYEKDIVKSINEILPNTCNKLEQAIQELDKFKALLNKYEIKDIKALEELINDYDDMAKALVEHVLGVNIEVKS